MSIVVGVIIMSAAQLVSMVDSLDLRKADALPLFFSFSAVNRLHRAVPPEIYQFQSISADRAQLFWAALFALTASTTIISTATLSGSSLSPFSSPGCSTRIGLLTVTSVLAIIFCWFDPQ